MHLPITSTNRPLIFSVFIALLFLLSSNTELIGKNETQESLFPADANRVELIPLAPTSEESPLHPQTNHRSVFAPVITLWQSPNDFENGYEPYWVGQQQVSAYWYCNFLNHVASKEDPNHLYDPRMAQDPSGMFIERSGSVGKYRYHFRTDSWKYLWWYKAWTTVTERNFEDLPVHYVNLYNTLRFCNWVHNNCPQGNQDESTTENGAYTLTGPTSGELTPHEGAICFIPDNSQWDSITYTYRYTAVWYSWIAPDYNYWTNIWDMEDQDSNHSDSDKQHSYQWSTSTDDSKYSLPQEHMNRLLRVYTFHYTGSVFSGDNINHFFQYHMKNNHIPGVDPTTSSSDVGFRIALSSDFIAAHPELKAKP